MTIDMWYGNKPSEVDALTIAFYPNDGQYRGNTKIKGKYVGDYVCGSSTELEKAFPQLRFNWD